MYPFFAVYLWEVFVWHILERRLFLKQKTTEHGKLKIIPLGGLEQIGMNITAFEYEDNIIVVDCGLSFPEDDMLGIDLVIPDITYLKENIEKVKGFFITHGHEDHIGAIPYVLKEINVPIYATKLTIGIIDHKLKEHNMLTKVKRKVVKYGQHINLGNFRVEFIKTNHSIQDAAALAIYSPAGIVVHTGDFKVDYTPVFGDAIDLARLGEIGKKGVLALMCDSTNAERPGFTMSERTVGRTFDNIFSEHKNSRIIIATFASNVDRVQQIINSACKYGRKVVVEGRSMVNIISTATELGYLDIPDNTLIDVEHLKNYPDEQTVLITTGSQGESMAALSRMASGMHKKITIKPKDTIIFSSNPIPGNEKAVSNVINELFMKGADVIFQDAHVSGHACQEDIKLIYSLVRPKYAIPVHGEYRHLMAQKKVAEELGYEKENIFILSSGDVLELDEESANITGHVHVGNVMVDGLGVGDVGNIVLRDRQHLAEEGIIIVVLTLQAGSGQVIAGPDIVSRGFVYVRGSESLMDEAKQVLDGTMEQIMEKNITDWGRIKTDIKDSLGEFVWKETKRKPMIIPIIMEV
ncbi:ribonuclease J1 [Lachnospiraceae bacterium]|jgi:ribonuclease J|nr:ribonuclease J [Eubacterium sp.]GFI26868.1 ribonuclease J1 [Lachnospiraceae bacterium]